MRGFAICVGICSVFVFLSAPAVAKPTGEEQPVIAADALHNSLSSARLVRSAQLDLQSDNLDLVEDQLAVESAALPSRTSHEVMVVPKLPGYGILEEEEEAEEVAAALEAELEDTLDHYVGGGRRQARSAPDTLSAVDHSGLVANVPADAVKVKSHGRYGHRVQHQRTAGGLLGRSHYERAFSTDEAEIVPTPPPAIVVRARRMSEDFIPFSEYDTRRVKTLKLEQNDFLALPLRLEQEVQRSREAKALELQR